jgi:anaerobic magnesium-protoporphyrin IX monomethyl ester cyclase
LKKLTLIQFQYEPDSVPLGSLFLASGLEKEGLGFDLRIFPFYKYGYDLEKLSSFAARSGDIVAIGCWSDMLPYVLVAADKLKKRFPGKTVVLGGIGPTKTAQEIMAAFDSVDFILKGCGVDTLPELIKRIEAGGGNFSDIDGLVYRNNNAVVSNRYRGFHLHIPGLPAYHRIENIRQYDKFPIYTSLGCPFACTFCDARLVTPGKVVYRDLREVVEEIKLVASIKKPRAFYLTIMDEAFVIDKRRVFEFCALLKAERLNIEWGCYGRVGAMDEALLKAMSASGCRGLFYGIESGSNAILKEIRKGFTIEDAIGTLVLSKKHVEEVTASFIYLFPFEQTADFYHTKTFIWYLRAKGIKADLHALTPVKGSEIYRTYKKDLFLSKGINSTSRPALNAVPGACMGMIKKHPDIFYHYYTYDFARLREIAKIAETLRQTKRPAGTGIIRRRNNFLDTGAARAIIKRQVAQI